MRYYISDLGTKLRNFIQSCGLCLKVKDNRGEKVHVPLQMTAGRTCTKPWQRIQMDFAGPIPSNKYSARYLLIVVCEFTGLVRIFACERTTAAEVVEKLVKLFRTYGIPSAGSCLSDRGSSFRNEVCEGVSAAYGVSWSFGLSQSPWMTGLAESRVKLTKHLCRNIVLGNSKVDLYEALDEVMYSINSTPSSETGLSSHFLFFGWQPVDPIDFKLNVDSVLPKNLVTYAQEIKKETALRQDLVKEIKKYYAEHRAEKYNNSISDRPVLKPGDLVLLETGAHTGSSKQVKKFKIRNSGPFRVRKTEGYACILEDMDGQILPDLISQRRIRKIPQYVDTLGIDRVNCITENNGVVQAENRFTQVRVLGRRKRICGEDYVLVRSPYDSKSTMWIREEFIHKG